MEIHLFDALSICRLRLDDPFRVAVVSEGQPCLSGGSQPYPGAFAVCARAGNFVGMPMSLPSLHETTTYYLVSGAFSLLALRSARRCTKKCSDSTFDS